MSAFCGRKIVRTSKCPSSVSVPHLDHASFVNFVNFFVTFVRRRPETNGSFLAFVLFRQTRPHTIANPPRCSVVFFQRMGADGDSSRSLDVSDLSVRLKMAAG